MKKIVIIMILALAASTAFSAPRTTKKRHKKAQRVERVERYDSAVVCIYGETPEGVMRQFIEALDFLHEALEKCQPFLSPAFEVGEMQKMWRRYDKYYGHILRRDAGVWRLFRKAGEDIDEMARQL